MKVQRWIERRFYPNSSDNWDDGLFRQRILWHLSRDMHVLDIGAGAGIVEAMNFKGLAANVCGIDLDVRVIDNPFLDEGKVADASDMPFASESFDLVFADNVMEHLEKPHEVYQEIFRVLKPGGILLFKTPNRCHYMPLIAQMTPLVFHRFVNRLRGRDIEDTFPTKYRSNSVGQIKRLIGKTGFEISYINQIEGRPEYLRFWFPFFILGTVYERLVNATEFLRDFRILLIAELKKPEK